ncbi:hypothetical protein BDF22DRAFT_744988 [Syncephalis plumigaleata]|nr:hypothetical protein BDF22DRAFT_744988 [Syncephalis plumigaleata]
MPKKLHASLLLRTLVPSSGRGLQYESGECLSNSWDSPEQNITEPRPTQPLQSVESTVLSPPSPPPAKQRN